MSQDSAAPAATPVGPPAGCPAGGVPKPGGIPATGPQGLALAGHLRAMKRNALTASVAAARRYGDVYSLKVAGPPQIWIHRAEHVDRVMVVNQDNYVKGSFHEIYASAFGNGLIVSNGELWRRQRRLIQPMFAKRHLNVFTDHMTASGAAMLDEWQRQRRENTVIDFADETMGLTLDVVGRALFGSDLTGPVRHTISEAMEDFVNEAHAAIVSPLTWAAYAVPGVSMEQALLLRPRQQRRFKASMARLDKIVYSMLDSHRVERDEPDDLVSLLMKATDEETGEPMGDKQVRDEVVNFIVAGHETTASTLAWMFQLLSTHPDIRDRMYAEVDDLLGGQVPTFADVDKLVYTSAVVQETLRLYPVVWMTTRQAVSDDVIGGVHIPAGAIVAPLMWLTHRDPEIWPNPEGFDPTRFLNTKASDRPRCAFVPFTAGRRVCLGNTFALIESSLLAAMIAQRYILDLAVEPVDPEPTLTLRPRGGMPMRLRPR